MRPMEFSSKSTLPRLATASDSILPPSDTGAGQVLSSPFPAAQTLEIADNLHDGRVPRPRIAVKPLIHKAQKKDAVYEGLGIGLPSPTTHSPPISVTHPQMVATGEQIQHSQPVQIEAHDPSEQDGDALSSVALSPAMQFLNNYMSSPISLPASPPRSSSSLSPTEPDRIGPYILGPVIASGGFSVIRKAASPTGVVAVKVISTSLSLDLPSPALLDQEISIWSNLHHENVLPLFSSYRFPGSIYLVTLLCPEGSLLDVLRHHGHPGLALDDAGTMFRQIVRGLKYLHEEAKIVHGDIKLENILLDEMGACRIADFGLAKPIPPPGSAPAPAKERPFEPLTRSDSVSSAKSTLPPHLRGRSTARRASSYVPSSPADPTSVPVIAPGSLPYAAPELLVQHATRAHQRAIQHIPDPAQDIWALGCVLHALLYGRLPFVDTYEPRLVDKILSGRWSHSASPASRSKSRSRTRREAAAGYWGTGARRSQSRGAAHRRKEGVRIGAGAKRVLKGCLVVEAEKRWTIAQIHEVSWNVGWGEHDLEETEIIIEQPLSPQGGIHSPFIRDSCHSSPFSNEEQEDDAANGGGWETVDDEDPLATRRMLVWNDRGSSSSSSRRSADDRHIPDVPSLTLSTGSTTKSLPTLSPTREGRCGGGAGAAAAAAAAGRRNLSSDSGRYGAVIHEGDEDGPLTPIDGDGDGDDEELLKPRIPIPMPIPAGRVVVLPPTTGNEGSKRFHLDSFDLDVPDAPATM